MSLTQPLLVEINLEANKTRKCLERLSEEHFSWKPHEKSMSLIQLASHIAALINWIPKMMEGDEFDTALGNPVSRVEPPATTTELLQRFDKALADALHTLSVTNEALLQKSWTFRRGEQVVFSIPRLQVIRFMVLSHSIHHRGQLTVYMRQLNIPVPSIYGPSADEAF